MYLTKGNVSYISDTFRTPVKGNPRVFEGALSLAGPLHILVEVLAQLAHLDAHRLHEQTPLLVYVATAQLDQDPLLRGA